MKKCNFLVVVRQLTLPTGSSAWSGNIRAELAY